MKVEFKLITDNDKVVPALCIETAELYKARLEEQELLSFKLAVETFTRSNMLTVELPLEECLNIINKSTIKDNILIITVVAKDGKQNIQFMYAKIPESQD